jgi:hypothetical protein
MKPVSYVTYQSPEIGLKESRMAFSKSCRRSKRQCIGLLAVLCGTVLFSMALARPVIAQTTGGGVPLWGNGVFACTEQAVTASLGVSAQLMTVIFSVMRLLLAGYGGYSMIDAYGQYQQGTPAWVAARPPITLIVAGAGYSFMEGVIFPSC